jgi:hypothetical protein
MKFQKMKKSYRLTHLQELVKLQSFTVYVDKYGTNFNKDRSKKLWDKLYELALEDSLHCLKSLLD